MSDLAEAASRRRIASERERQYSPFDTGRDLARGLQPFPRIRATIPLGSWTEHIYDFIPSLVRQRSRVMAVLGARPLKWVLKIVPVAHGYDVYSEFPTLAFYSHARTLEEAQAVAARQPTKEEALRMLLASA